jgi:hypothetical protein
MKSLRDQIGGAPAGAARCALAALAVLFALTSGAGRATADDVRLFQLTDIRGFAELGFFTSIQDRSRTTSPASTANRVEFSQLLNVSAIGYAYHPSFLTFEGGFQVEFIEDVLEQLDHRILPGGHFRFNFLENHRNGLSIFGRILRTEQQPPFSEKFSVLSQVYGATLYQRWGWIPFSLTYQHRSLENDAPGSFDDSAEEILFRGGYELGERSRGSIDYDLILQDQGGDDVRRQNLGVNNVSFFGDREEKKWFTNLFLKEEVTERDSGETKQYAAIGNTNFNWRHTDDLLTGYSLSGRWSDFGTQSVTTVSPSFLLTHTLYESLTSQVEIRSDLQKASTGSRYEIGGRISEVYLKRLGGWGRLILRAAPRITMTYDRPEADSAYDEEPEYEIAVPAVPLRNPNVIEDTILVRHVNCTFGPTPEECRNPEDYRVIPAGGGFVALQLTPGGLLEPDNPDDPVNVLVTYEYELGEKGDILSFGVDADANLWIRERVELFGRYQTNDRKVLSGSERNIRVNSFDRIVVGLNLALPWLSALLQFEDYDATFGPFRGYSGSLSLFSGFGASWQARGGVGYALRNYLDSGEDLSRLTASANVGRRLFRRGQLELRGRYRRERWSGEKGRTNNVDALYVNAGFSWWYGKIDVKLEGGMVQISREREDKRVFRVDLRVRRPF